MVKSLSPSGSVQMIPSLMMSPAGSKKGKASAFGNVTKNQASFLLTGATKKTNPVEKKRASSIPANKITDTEEAKIRASFEKKGYSMRMQSQRTQAVADTLNIGDEESRKKIQHDVDKIGRHILTDLKVPKWTEKDDNALRYI